MATLRELNRHLNSVKTVGQIAGAMRTISTAHYSRLKKFWTVQEDYESLLLREASLAGCAGFLLPAREDAPACYLIAGSNRGFCGAYNSLLFDYAKALVQDEEEKGLWIPINRSAEKFVSAQGLPQLASFSFDEDPDSEFCASIADLLLEKYRGGEIGHVVIIKQHYVNALVQNPEHVSILPFSEPERDAQAGDVLILPDRETLSHEFFRLFLIAQIRSQLLDATLALQAASMVAMRSAYDNAQEVSGKLSLEISRKRQAGVTASVIETASAAHSEEG